MNCKFFFTAFYNLEGKPVYRTLPCAELDEMRWQNRDSATSLLGKIGTLPIFYGSKWSLYGQS